MNLHQWAIYHCVSAQALHELRQIFNVDPEVIIGGESESAVQSRVRLEASRKGLKLWRNNVGAIKDERGIPVRFGLANDTKKLNEKIKSGDLIGWRPVLITPAHVGSTLAQFVSRECKKPAWTYTGTAHEVAQLRWIQAVTADGGDAKFCNAEGSL